MPNYIVRRRWKVGGEGQFTSGDRAPSEGKPAGQLNLARGAGGRQDLAHTIGEITCCILEDGVPVASKGKRALCITRNAKIWMVKQVISFHSNRDLPLVNDCKILV